MTLPANGKLNCCVCGQSYADGQIKCSLCGFLLNSDLDILSDSFEAETERFRVELQRKVNEASQEISAACSLNIPGDLQLTPPITTTFQGEHKSAAEKGLNSLRDSLKCLVEGETPAITILDDGADQLSVYVIKADGQRLNITEKSCDWTNLYPDYPKDFDFYRKSLVLVGGLREYRREALSNWIDKINASGTVYHSSPYLQASHSQSIDEVLKEKIGEFQKILLERECQNKSDIKDVLNHLCRIAPLSAAIEVLSATVDPEGNVTTKYITIFPKGINIDDINPVELSITTADQSPAGGLTVELGFYHSDDHSKPWLVKGITLAPGQTKNIELKLVSRDGKDFIEYSNDRLQTLQQLSPIPSKVDRVRPLNLILVVDCIGTEKKLVQRKKIIKDLITELSRQNNLVKYSICTYSCEFYPLSSKRKPNWPEIYSCNLNLALDNALAEIEKFKYFPEDDAPFPGMLELVLKKLSEEVSEEQNTYVLIIGNRPANPHEDQEALMGVKEDWEKYFNLLRQRKARISALHPEPEEIKLEEWKTYNEYFWKPFDAVGRESAMQTLLPSTQAQTTLKVPTVTLSKNM